MSRADSPPPVPVRRRSFLAGLTLGVLVALVGCGPEDASARPRVVVFAAASLSDVLEEVAAGWTPQSGVDVSFSFGPTSKLVPQIEQGAPADALFSADEAWMKRLADAGKVDEASRAVVARNELVFVVPQRAPDAPAAPTALPGTLRSISLAGENVPAGRYAKAALEHAGVWAAVAPRVKPGEDVRLTLRLVATDEVDGGVVYRTDALAEPRVRVAFAFSADSHPPIVYPAAAVVGAAQRGAAARFVAYCRGPQAQAVFRKHGFAPPTP